MSRPRLVVFDCDGTLVDSQHAIIEAMTRAFVAHGLAAPTREAVRRVVGLSLVPAVAGVLGDEELTDRAYDIAETYKKAFHDLRQEADHDEPLYPGTVEILTSLKDAGFLLGVATGKSDRGLKSTLAMHGIEDHFITLQTADRHPSKPHPAMLQQAMADAGVEPADTVVIGDTSYDILMAVKAGAHAIGVNWGYHDAEELVAAGARCILSEFAELTPQLDDLFKR